MISMLRSEEIYVKECDLEEATNLTERKAHQPRTKRGMCAMGLKFELPEKDAELNRGERLGAASCSVKAI